MNNGMGKFVLMMLMASGADIVAPDELKEQATDFLGLKDNTRFKNLSDSLKNVNQEEKATFIKGLILTCLTPTQMMSLHQTIKTGISAQLEYIHDHPEEKGESLDPEIVMKRLSELD